MSGEIRSRLLSTLRHQFRIACRCEAIALQFGLHVKAHFARLLQAELIQEINVLEWEARR
jgi:hypothetical protein